MVKSLLRLLFKYKANNKKNESAKNNRVSVFLFILNISIIYDHGNKPN